MNLWQKLLEEEDSLQKGAADGRWEKEFETKGKGRRVQEDPTEQRRLRHIPSFSWLRCYIKCGRVIWKFVSAPLPYFLPLWKAPPPPPHLRRHGTNPRSLGLCSQLLTPGFPCGKVFGISDTIFPVSYLNHALRMYAFSKNQRQTKC